MTRVSDLKNDLLLLANPKKAQFFPRFFKAGKGEYAEGDKFLGVTVPNVKKVASKYKDLDSKEIGKLLASPLHEERMVALTILVTQFTKADSQNQQAIFDLYLANTRYINNWDLVDLSCYKIVGQFLLAKDRTLLYKLAKSDSLWERRIAVVSTYQFIRSGQFEDTKNIALLLLKDKHDLIHKAVGWMLREMGKRSFKDLDLFLRQNYAVMPRTALRYAIEKYPEEARQQFLKGAI